MRTIAILAPPIDGLTPDRFERAQNAMLQQMMLLARGLPVTHPAVRAAAEIVGSAIAADPIEFAIAANGYRPDPPQPDKRVPVQPSRPTQVRANMTATSASPSIQTRRGPTAPALESDDGAGARRGEAYARYLATIYATQPSSPRKSGADQLPPGA